MNHKSKEKLDSILFHICMALTILSAIPILYGVFEDNTKVFFIGIGIFSICLICAAINDPPYYYDDEGDTNSGFTNMMFLSYNAIESEEEK